MTHPGLLPSLILALACLAAPAAHKPTESPAAGRLERVIRAVRRAFTRVLITTEERHPPARPPRSDVSLERREGNARKVAQAVVDGREGTSVDGVGWLGTPRAQVAEAKLKALLSRKCAACHGARNRVVDQFNVVGDLDSLVEQEYVVPGQHPQSRVWQRVQKGEMPPPTLRALGKQEQDDLRRWIDELPDEPRLPTIMEAGGADPRCSFLVEAAKAAELDQELSAGGPWTILAPTTDAFRAFGAENLMPPRNGGEHRKLWMLVVNHGARGKLSAEALEEAGQVTTLSHVVLKVRRQQGRLWIGDAVVQESIECSDGWIHVINRVIPPPGFSLEREIPLVMPMVHVRGGQFMLGKYEVTRGEYIAIMGWDPSFDKPRLVPPLKGWAERRAVQHVTWIHAVKFCNALSRNEGYAPYYKIDTIGDKEVVTMLGGNGYRLPAEAEWECACRAGSTTEYCFGDDEAALGDYAWHRDNLPKGPREPQPVGTKNPNAWGLYDMHGNVQEWCEDWFDAGRTQKVFRGGSYFRAPDRCRSTDRAGGTSTGIPDLDFKHASIGFRVARTRGGGEPAPIPGQAEERE